MVGLGALQVALLTTAALVGLAHGITHVNIGQLVAVTGTQENFTAPFVMGSMIAHSDLEFDPDFADYNFTRLTKDTQGTKQLGIKETLRFAGVNLDDTVTEIPIRAPIALGPLFSGEAIVSNYIAQDGGILQISPSATSPALSDKSSYPTFSRMLASDTSQGQAVANMVQSFGWKKVAVLFTSDDYGTGLKEAFVQSCGILKIDVAFAQSFPSRASNTQVSNQVQQLLDSEIRIIFLSMILTDLKVLLPELRSRKMIGPPFVYLGPDGLSFEQIDSTWSDIAAGMLATGPLAPSTGEKYLDFASKYRTEFNYASDYIIPNSAPFMYDCVYAAAHTIKMYDTIKTSCENSEGIYDNYCYLFTSSFHKDKGLALFIALTKYVQFEGVTGIVDLDDNGNREDALWGIYNGVGTNWITAGSISVQSAANATVTKGSIIWPDSATEIPPDAPKQIVSYTGVTSSGPHYVVFAALTSIVHAFSICVLIFNVVYAEKPVVKVTSPRLNTVIILGLIIMLSYIYIEPFQTAGACYTKVGVVTIGFSLLFGTLLVKIFRVFRIFQNAEKGKSVVMSDNKLILFVVFLVSLDVLILLIWGLVSPFTYVIRTNVLPLESKVSIYQNVNVEGSCSSNSKAFFIIQAIIKAIILLIGIYMAVRTRNVSFKVLNDSRPVAFSIYSGTITLVVLFFSIVYGSINGKATFSLVSVFFLVFVVSTEILLFGPRMYSVYTNEPFDLGEETDKDSVVAGLKDKDRPSSATGRTSHLPRSSKHEAISEV